MVFINLQAARISMLDIERFKRQVNYCLLPNGTATLMAMQVHGRYNDLTPYGFMNKMGIWLENFSLPVVVNECLMQSYDGTIRLFPNWPLEKDAEFHDLRAAGAFLVSASLKSGKVEKIEIVSEAGSPLKIILPWKTIYINGTKADINPDGVVNFSTKKGEVFHFSESQLSH